MTTLPNGKYLFHISNEENDQYFNMGIAVYITPSDYWDENKVIADHYTDEELDELTPVLEEVDLAEVMQSTYESINYINEEKLKIKMLNAGFVESTEFSDYIESFKEEDLWSDDDSCVDEERKFFETYEE